MAGEDKVSSGGHKDVITTLSLPSTLPYVRSCLPVRNLFRNKLCWSPDWFFFRPKLATGTNYNFSYPVVPIYRMNPTLNQYVSRTLAHIIESSHICPGQEYFMSTQPPPTSSPLCLHLRYWPKNRNQSRQEWLCFQSKKVFAKVWVGEERGREMRKGGIWQKPCDQRMAPGDGHYSFEVCHLLWMSSRVMGCDSCPAAVCNGPFCPYPLS